MCSRRELLFGSVVMLLSQSGDRLPLAVKDLARARWHHQHGRHPRPTHAATGKDGVFTSALDEDPTLARAWVDLAWAYGQTINYGADWATAHPLALAAARRAVEADPMDSRPMPCWAHDRPRWELFSGKGTV